MQPNLLSAPDEPSPLDLLLRAEFDLDQAERFRRRGDAALGVLLRYADELKPLRPTWLTDDDDHARFIRGVESLRRARDTPNPITVDMLDATQAAERMGLMRPDRKPPTASTPRSRRPGACRSHANGSSPPTSSTRT